MKKFFFVLTNKQYFISLGIEYIFKLNNMKMKVTETPSNTDSLANESPSSVLRRLTKFIKDLMQPSTQLGSVQKTY